MPKVKTLFFAKEFDGINSALEEHKSAEAALLKMLNTSTNDVFKGSITELLNRLHKSKSQLLEDYGKKEN